MHAQTSREKQLIETIDKFDEDRGEPYVATRLTETGWNWIENNESLFSLRKSTQEEFDDSIPLY